MRGVARCDLAAAVAGCALLLSGCMDIYEETCVWHSDLNIKGCDYYGFRSCIHHCTYCVTSEGPDECGQLKCAAYCAQRNGDDACVSNFKSLCGIAVQEQSHLGSCDVDCSSAIRSVPTALWLLLLAFLVHFVDAAGVPVPEVSLRRLTLLCILAIIGVALHGCCDDPEPQLDWEPDFEDLKGKADWYDDNGIWRGNPTWSFSPHHEAEEYQCKVMHESRPICVVWTSKEWNCHEEDFGLCKCHALPSDGDYCQAWGCHSLEADQNLCNVDSENSVTCNYEAFHMDESVYSQLVERQASGDLTTGETWWTFIDLFSNRRLSADEGALRGRNATASPRRLDVGTEWPPAAAYRPTSRWRHFDWNEVCIANGDNLAIVREKCSSWREIETEISQCRCKKGSSNACLEWFCEERDVGLFSVLFRTSQSISDLTVGTEQEDYTCKAFDGGPGTKCVAWEGDISSVEEVEWSRCECVGGSCHSVGAKWRCDEYELPRTRELTFEDYRGRFAIFLIIESLLLFGVCNIGTKTKAGEKGQLGAAVCMSSSVAVIVFPFLMVTFGAPGFLALGLPFWVLRCGCGCYAYYATVRGGGGSGGHGGLILGTSLNSSG